MFSKLKNIALLVLVLSTFLATGKFCIAAIFEGHDYHNSQENRALGSSIDQGCVGVDQMVGTSVTNSNTKVKIVCATNYTSLLAPLINTESQSVKTHFFTELFLPPPEKEMLASIFKKE